MKMSADINAAGNFFPLDQRKEKMWYNFFFLTEKIIQITVLTMCG